MRAKDRTLSRCHLYLVKVIWKHHKGPVELLNPRERHWGLTIGVVPGHSPPPQVTKGICDRYWGPHPGSRLGPAQRVVVNVEAGHLQNFLMGSHGQIPALILARIWGWLLHSVEAALFGPMPSPSSPTPAPQERLAAPECGVAIYTLSSKPRLSEFGLNWNVDKSMNRIFKDRLSDCGSQLSFQVRLTCGL